MSTGSTYSRGRRCCSELSRTGDGRPSRTLTVGQVTSYGYFALRDPGVYLGVELIRPRSGSGWADRHLRGPATGSSASGKLIDVSDW